MNRHELPLPIQDPVYALVQMGCQRLYDYRVMDYNLVRNLAKPDLDLGATVLADGGFEGPYSGGVASGWNWVGTGTPSEETNLPWESEGTSAQRITNDTKYGSFILSHTMTGTFLQKQTYQVKFKLKVESGFCRIRVTCYNLPFEIAASRDFEAGDEGEFVVYGACGRNPATAISMQIYNTGTSTPLTLVVDDMTVKPLQNDTHVYIDSQGFDDGAKTMKGYEYNAGAWSHGKNWNKNGDMTVGGEHTCFTLFTPESTCYTLQAQWNAADNDKSFGYELWPATNRLRGLLSADGSTTSAQYYNDNQDTFADGRCCIFNEYDAAGGTEGFRYNRDDDTITYSAGGHVNPLHTANGAPYLHAALISGSGSYIERGSGIWEVAGWFDRGLSQNEKELVEAILLYHR